MITNWKYRGYINPQIHKNGSYAVLLKCVGVDNNQETIAKIIMPNDSVSQHRMNREVAVREHLFHLHLPGVVNTVQLDTNRQTIAKFFMPYYDLSLSTYMADCYLAVSLINARVCS